MILRGIMKRSGVVREDDIQAYADGWLEGARLRQVEQHLLTCPEDAERVTEYRRINAGLASLGRLAQDSEIPDPLAAMVGDLRDALVCQRRVRRTVAGAVGSVLLLGTSSGVWMLSGSGPGPSEPTFEVATVAQPDGGIMPVELGVRSETFIEWDVNQLLPGRTVAIADPPPHGETVVAGPSWTANCPSLVFTPVSGDPWPDREREQAVIELLRQHQVRLVMLEFLDFAERWFDVCQRPDLSVWIRGHGADLSVRISQSYRRFATATGIIVPTRAAAERAISVGLPRSLVHVVPNHVEVPAQPRAHPPRELFRCVTVGRLVRKKGHHYLLQAFQQAVRREPRLRLDVIGDGPLRPDLEEYVYRNGLEGNVRFIGALSSTEVLQRIRTADLLVHHAVTAPDGDVEAQPLAILQGMAAALPCVVSRHEGIPDTVDDSAILVDEGATAHLAEALVECAADPARCRQLGERGWSLARERYTHEGVRAQLLDLLGLEA